MIFFCIRKYPDIDNFVPIIKYLINNCNQKIIILSLNIDENLRYDFRILYLLKKYKNLDFINLDV